MLLQFVWVGKTRNRHLKSLVQDYLDRLSRFAPVQVVELKEERADRGRQRETERILRALRDPGINVVLDPQGEAWDSGQWADFLGSQELRATRVLRFVLGSFWGLSPAVGRQAGRRVSLSRMTVTHEIARLLTVEQVYRAYTLQRNLPYAK
ncbi:MAG: 23S rRNA (pseudouridine(1915)-N(3))-methyltransferase RlmH [Acidobacteria bacterium]|nr:23S rRNA (pseudouridine(1915)-N(3))-methyltransferase RlmH [Acidobacteriota bacterium]